MANKTFYIRHYCIEIYLLGCVLLSCAVCGAWNIVAKFVVLMPVFNIEDIELKAIVLCVLFSVGYIDFD